MTGFARLASSTILASGMEVDGQGMMTRLSYRSVDGGKTFQPWATPSLRALAERGGKLYGAADNARDPFALGVSTDEGMTFTPMMKFSSVAGIKRCVQTACAPSCLTQATQMLWPKSGCSPPGSGCSYDRGWKQSGALGLGSLFVFTAAPGPGQRGRPPSPPAGAH